MSRRSSLALGLLLLLSSGLAAQNHPNADRGFSSDKAFQVGDIDHVNLFNGNLVVTIPIGGSYPAGGGLSYRLTLVYNSNVWDFQERDEIRDGKTYIQARPFRESNAGLGWSLSLGRLYQPGETDANGWAYWSSDGAEHRLFPTLHPGDADEAGDTPTSQSVQYTRDGSYLRLKKAGSEWTLEFPDGALHTFNASRQLRRIEDRFGNFLNIAHSANLWTLTDSQGRTHKVHFRSLNYAGQSRPSVDRVELAAFNGTTATWSFAYSENVSVPQAFPANDLWFPASVPVPLLTSVTLPDGSGYEMPVTDYATSPTDSWGFGPRWSGALLGLRLPTLGRLEWTHGSYQFPDDSSTKAFWQTSPGVTQRRLVDASGAVLGTWSYASGATIVPRPQPGRFWMVEKTTTVTDPLGHQRIHHFSVGSDAAGWSTGDYGLPFSRNNPDPAGGGRFLSSQVKDSSGTLLRSTYLRHERDGSGATEAGEAAHNNRRVDSERTVYHDDQDRYATVDHSEFDGLGHYRKSVTGGDFGSGNARTATMDYNPSRGIYKIDPATNLPLTGHTFTMLPSTSPWLLETFSSQKAEEGGSTATALFCFNASTGFLNRKRTLKNPGTAEHANDLLEVYTAGTSGDAMGSVVSERFYGGDPQSLTANNTTCTMGLPASPAYQIDHTYQEGAIATSQYSGTSFKALDRTIDANTGLPSSGRDSAGLETQFEYDSLGRLTWSKPATGHGGWTEYAYTPATSSTALADVLVKQRDNGSKTATVLAQSQIYFDAFGRVWKERQLLPGSVWNTRETLYDALGQKTSVSELQSGTPTKKTQFLGYDPFGRPTTIRPPDGSSHDVTFDYTGARVVQRTVSVGTGAGGAETSSTTREIYDRQGRLWRVAEPSGSGGAEVITTYAYDVGNRLKEVSTPATVGGAAVTQTRSFSYDQRGFLLSETHPEKGASGNGSVTWSNYDARGHAGRKIDGPNDLTFTYDSAERLIKVHEASGTLLKEFEYTSTNGASEWSAGKLREATRYNAPLAGFTVAVAETYTYKGRDGRVSRRDTAVTTNGTLGESFYQTFTWNPLSQAETVGYPVCTHTGCTTPAPAVFSDVPAGHADRAEIEGIYRAGITGGCFTNPLSYCPNTSVTRAQMAVFLLASKEGVGYTPPACTTPTFSDVPCSSPYAVWIEELYRRGITGGCATNPLRYCPGQSVTHGQMAVFLLATEEGTGFTPPSCATAPFTDVPCSNGFAAWIAEVSRRQIDLGCGEGNFCPTNPVTRGQMAGLLVRTFDIPVLLSPTTSRNLQFTYTSGLLTGVTGYASLSYHPNLLVHQVTHGNGLAETQANDTHAMRRPLSLGAAGPYASWSSGNYTYDGAGNIETMGSSTFLYDPVSRLTSGTVYTGPMGGGTAQQQTYTFDPFGNLTAIGATNGRNTPTSASTNRLNGAVTYDAAGNLTYWNGAAYEYDRFNQMTRMTSGSEDWLYLYTADDERLWSFKLGANRSRWTLRDLEGKVLREYDNHAGLWSVGSDYIYRDGQLLAAETRTGRRHFHLDHLGTPRLLTRASGYPAAYHVYFPFGEEATAFNQDTERMKFTGHERDLASPAGAGDDLDYMHARHCSPSTGRFHSVDPTMESVDPFVPQSWNRYNYVQSNPLVYVDPTGELLVFTGSQANLEKLRKLVNDSLHGHELVINKNGTAQLVANNVQGPASPEQAALASVLSSTISRSEVVRIGVESGASDVRIGSYVSGKVDIQDIGAMGSGPRVSSAAAFAHEVIEQTAKQIFHLSSNSRTDAAIAHTFGIGAQDFVSGFTRGRTNDDLFNRGTGTGYTLTEQTQGNQTVTVLIKWVNGNIVKVIRR